MAAHKGDILVSINGRKVKELTKEEVEQFAEQVYEAKTKETQNFTDNKAAKPTEAAGNARPLAASRHVGRGAGHRANRTCSSLRMTRPSILGKSKFKH